MCLSYVFLLVDLVLLPLIGSIKVGPTYDFLEEFDPLFPHSPFFNGFRATRSLKALLKGEMLVQGYMMRPLYRTRKEIEDIDRLLGLEELSSSPLYQTIPIDMLSLKH